LIAPFLFFTKSQLILTDDPIFIKRGRSSEKTFCGNSVEVQMSRPYFFQGMVLLVFRWLLLFLTFSSQFFAVSFFFFQPQAAV
jgi:hypothetical protein